MHGAERPEIPEDPLKEEDGPFRDHPLGNQGHESHAHRDRRDPGLGEPVRQGIQIDTVPNRPGMSKTTYSIPLVTSGDST